MKRTLTIYDVPPSLNTLINVAKRHWGAYASLKKTWKKYVNSAINPNWQPFIEPVVIEITYCFEDNRKRDLDNYVPKLLFDGLTKKENPDKFLLYDDTTNWIVSYSVKIKYGCDKKQTKMVIKNKRTK